MGNPASVATLLRSEPFQALRLCAGFDAFVDSLYHVVETRQDSESFVRMQGMGDLASFVAQAAGKSANLELCQQGRRPGGNAALFAIAASHLSAQVTALATVGSHVGMFRAAAPAVDWIDLGEPARTDALEFLDGKLMLGKMEGIDRVAWPQVEQAVGADRFMRLVCESDLTMFGNWTMMLGLTSVWEAVAARLPEGPGPLVLVYIADPRKRTRADLQACLSLLGRLGRRARVVLALNQSEAEQTAGALGLPFAALASGEALESACEAIAGSMGIHGVVIHCTKVAGAWLQGRSAWVPGPYCLTPVLTTGAGDHFNAGLGCALAAGWELRSALLCGVASAGFLVSQGRSASPRELAQAVQEWTRSGLLDAEEG